MSDEFKKQVAHAALAHVKDQTIIGVGTGSTVNFFIDELANLKHQLEGAVASSVATEKRLKALGIPVLDLNTVGPVQIYVDGADEVNLYLQCIKGGGGALTREKIIASAANKFICIADQTKHVKALGKTFLPIEVIPMARSYVARVCVKMGGDPIYREGFVTDNGNIILDVYRLNYNEPEALESQLNDIPGVVCNGLFAKRPADMLLLAGRNGIETFTR